MGVKEFYLIYLAALSFLTFILYAVDKGKARRGAWRIPEKALLSLSFFGGAVGGISCDALRTAQDEKMVFPFRQSLGACLASVAVGLSN